MCIRDRLTITSLAAGVVGVAAVTTNISVTTTTIGRPEGTIVEYYLNQDGTLTTTTSSTNVKIGTAVSATDLFLYSTSTVDNYVQSQQKIEFTDLSIGANATPSGEGSIAYNNTTGIFTFTPTKVINSASLTGVPTAPTAAAGTDTTQLATTAFVSTAVAQGGGGVNIDGGLSNSIRNTTTIALDGGGASG